jgi:hypothetical protein
MRDQSNNAAGASRTGRAAGTQKRATGTDQVIEDQRGGPGEVGDE